jgi:hypothetical protein
MRRKIVTLILIVILMLTLISCVNPNPTGNNAATQAAQATADYGRQVWEAQLTASAPQSP